jgi:hypothetical protein
MDTAGAYLHYFSSNHGYLLQEKITLRMACLIWRNTQESRQRVDVNLAHSQTSSAKMHVVRQGEYGTQVMHLFLVSFLA